MTEEFMRAHKQREITLKGKFVAKNSDFASIFSRFGITVEYDREND